MHARLLETAEYEDFLNPFGHLSPGVSNTKSDNFCNFSYSARCWSAAAAREPVKLRDAYQAKESHIFPTPKKTRQNVSKTLRRHGMVTLKQRMSLTPL